MGKMFEVFDLWCAAFLVLCGHPVLATVPGRWVGFQFDDGDGGATEAYMHWRRGAVAVDIHQFIAAYRELRRRVWREREAQQSA